jgi:hypothetical protein
VRQPFEVTRAELEADLDSFVNATYTDLESAFLVMPRGQSFVEYARFQEAYECLKRRTGGFTAFTPDTLWQAMLADSLVLLVVRAILGLTPPEWAYLTTNDTGVRVEQNNARTLDRKVRVQRDYFARLSPARSPVTLARVEAMVRVACDCVAAGAPAGSEDTVHRLDKVDTAEGLVSLRRAADLHVPFAVLLYERYLGLPYQSHRNSVSELIGDVMESAIEHRLQTARITYRKTGRAERVPGFDQAPDFIVPTEYAPEVVIEAKLTNDDGTARDKFTRIIHLAELSRARIAEGKPGFQVVACIDGRGFGVRREDMRRLLLSVDGKVFTLRTLDHLVPHTRLREFASAAPGAP